MADNNYPTDKTDDDDDNSLQQCRPADNLNAQPGGLPPKTLPPSPPPPPIEGATPLIWDGDATRTKVSSIPVPNHAADTIAEIKVTTDFGLLTVDCRLLTVLPLRHRLPHFLPSSTGKN